MRIRKGLDLPITGIPQQVIEEKPVSAVAVLGPDYIGTRPSLQVQEVEPLNHPLLTEKHLRYLAPFTSSGQINQKLESTPDVVHMKNTLHSILSLIEKHES